MNFDVLSEGPRLHVAYVGPVDYPSSTAPAQRMAGIIQALTMMGHTVSVGSGSLPNTGKPHRDEYGATVFKLGELPDHNWPKWRRVVRGLLWGGLTHNWIRRLHPAPDVILVYGTHLGYLARMHSLARKMAVPLVIDVTEWYKSSHLPGGTFGPFAFANALSMRVVAPKAQGAIVISSFLQDHFASSGMSTVRVPPLFVVNHEDRLGPLGAFPLRLCYVGSPGNKDRVTLENLVRLPEAIGVDASRLCINIVGIDERGASALLGQEYESDIVSENVVFHGRLPSEQARQIIRRSHFSVLQRGDARYAKAGFPSKIPESLILGTPVIANLTSDLAEFLVSGQNALLVGDSTLESLVTTVSGALRSKYEFDRSEISAAAASQFSPSKYGPAIHGLLQKCRSGVS